MACLEINCGVWGARNTFDGEAWVSPEGKTCPIKIQTSGHGKYSSGKGFITSEEYPNGVFRISVSQNGIEIKKYEPDGTIANFHDYRLASTKIIRYAEKFQTEADCYHCKCLSKHLQKSEEYAQES